MTKYAPNTIIFGNDLSYNINPIPQTLSNSVSIAEYIKYINNTRTIIQNTAVSNQSNHDQIRSKSFNKDRPPIHEYEVGDLILINISRRMTGNRAKLSPIWHGPHEIIHIIFPKKTYKIREIGNESHIQEINIKFIKPYKTTPKMMLMNYVTTNISYKSNNIVQYINQSIVLKTPSSKKRQLLCFS